MQQIALSNSHCQTFSPADTSGPRRVVGSLTCIWSRALLCQASLVGTTDLEDIQPWIRSRFFKSLYVCVRFVCAFRIWLIYRKQPISGGEAVVDGYTIRCFNGQRMDFELVADRQAGAVELDWFGTYYFELQRWQCILTGILVCCNRVGYSHDWHHHGDVYFEVEVELLRVLFPNTLVISMYNI